MEGTRSVACYLQAGSKHLCDGIRNSFDGLFVFVVRCHNLDYEQHLKIGG